MKKLITTILALAAIAPLSAQQLPNNGFEEPWVDCRPWTSANNTTVQGTTPKDWTASNVYAGTGLLASGNQTVAENVAGYNNSSSAIKVGSKSFDVPIFGKKIVPGYFTLGTTWSTSTANQNNDGGTFGGITFSSMPDAIEFQYMAEGGTSNAKPTVVAYLWNGTFIQKNVPGNITTSIFKLKKVDMIDRDLCVLGRSLDGHQGDKTLSEEGTLIASIISRPEIVSEWTKGKVSLEYKEGVSAKAEKFNIIFSAGDYFSTTPTEGCTMTVDDVKLLYYSRLESLSVNGTVVNLKDSVLDENGNRNYDLSKSVYMPKNVDAFSYTLLGESPAKTVSVNLDAENNTATITVKNTNEGAQDIDGKAEHVYTIKFKAPDYSRLKTLSVSDTEVQLEDGVYDYDLSASVYMPKNVDAFSYTVMGESSAVTVDIALDAENNTATITVKNTNEGAQDIDGKAEHVYTIKFKAPDYSRLKTLSVSGNEVQLEDGVYDYDLSASVYMPKNVDAFSYTVMGESSAVTVDIALDAENNTATITVKNTNEGAQDIDGKAEHVYTIKFKAPRVFTGIEYPGHITTLTWDADGKGHTSLIEEPVKASVWMTKKGLKRIVDVLLPDFTLPGIGTIGDILVENVTRTYNNNNGNPIYDYIGHVDDLSLAEGGIHAEVDLKGTSDVYGNVSFKIDVKWISNYEELHPQAIVAREPVEPVYIPIKVEFNGTTLTPEVPTGINDVTVDGADAPVEYFNLQGIRVSNPQAGQMVIRRQGTNVEKILVK